MLIRITIVAALLLEMHSYDVNGSRDHSCRDQSCRDQSC